MGDCSTVKHSNMKIASLTVCPRSPTQHMGYGTLIPSNIRGRRPNGFLGLSLNDGTILFLVISLDKTVHGSF